MHVAYLGPSGSFSHQVALRIFPEAELLACASLTDTIKAYETGVCHYAVVPVENTIEGSVHEIMDYLFHQTSLHAVAEIVQPIRQQLLARNPQAQITTIFSHPQALAQSKDFIDQHYPHVNLEATASTAYAAKFVAEHPDQGYAAIAPYTAAETYDLKILASDIQSLEANFTRFWILGDEIPPLEFEVSDSKLSLALTLPNNLPGALYKAMSTFAWRGIDLTKIESRPLKTALGEYFFILDARCEDPKLFAYALEELETMGISYKILGKYDVFYLENPE